MRLDFLCDLNLTYRDLPDFGKYFVLVQPYNTEEGSAYGEGDGTVSGAQLNGSLRWVNHPHRRSDSVMLPDAHGVILTDDKVTLLFSLQGRTHFVGNKGQQVLSMLFETQAEPYLWLNNALCVVEGVIVEKGMRARVYVCVHDMA